MCDFYCSKECGTIVHMIEDGGLPLYCNEKEMIRLVPSMVEGAKEKHLPVVTVKENCVEVNVGSDMHPMNEDHYITFVHVETNQGCMLQFIKDASEPKVCFALHEDQIVKKVQAYCNLHGMWQIEV